APDPADRYQQAADLAEDLSRFLDDRPLKHAPELSQTERVRKWLRRHPRLASSASVATVAASLLIGIPAALASVREHLATTQDQLEVRQASERKQAFIDGTMKAHCLVNTVSPLGDHLRQGQVQCEQTLNLFNILDRDDWQDHSLWRRLSPAERQLLAEDVQELFILLAWSSHQQRPGDRAVLRQSLAWLARAGAVPGAKPSKALWLDRVYYFSKLGKNGSAQDALAQAKQIHPATARDHYLLATVYARQGGRGNLEQA